MPGPLLMNVRHQLSRRSPSFGSECATGRAAGDVRASAPGRHRARGRRLVAQAPSKRSASCVPVRARPRERYALLATCGDHELCAPSVEQVEVDVEGRVRQVQRDWIRTRSHLEGRGPGTRRVRSVMVYHCTLCALRALRTPGCRERGASSAHVAVTPGHGARRSRPRRPRFDSGWRAQPAAPLDHVGRSSQVLLAQPCLAEGARPSAAPLSPTHPPASPQRTHSRTRIPTAHARDRRRRR